MINVLYNRTPTVAYSSTTSWTLTETRSVTIPLPAGNYYINVHINYNGNRVTGNTTWAITNATTIYNDNGSGNYLCNALFQGLFTTNGNDVVVSCTTTGSGTFPVVITVYKVWFSWTVEPYVKSWNSGYAASITVDISDYTDYQTLTVDKLHVYGTNFYGGADAGYDGYISCAPSISNYNSSTGIVTLTELNKRSSGRNIYVTAGVVIVY